jgi:gliding motility-associated-like protein
LNVLSLKAQLNAAFTADKTSGCSPLVVHFSNQTTGADGAASYRWDLGNGNTVVAENPQAVYTIPGSYTVTLTVTDGGQTSTTTGTVTVDQPPTVNFVANVTQGCAPTPMAFTSTSVAGSTPISTYLWDFGDGSTQTDPSYGQGVSHPYETAGVYGVSLTVTDADGCSSTKTVPNLMTILPMLTASFTTPQTVMCTANSPVAFTNTSTGPGTLSYQWAFGDGGSSTQPSPTYSYTAKGTYTVTLIVTSSVGCVAVDAQQDLLNVANFQTDFTVPKQICQGAAAVFTDSSIPVARQQSWLVDGAAAGTGTSLSYLFTTTGSHSIQLTNTYGTCTQSVTHPFVVNTAPVMPPFDAVQQSACGAPMTVNFLDHTPGAVQWQWAFQYNAYSSYQNYTDGGPAISTVYGENEDYQVQLTVTNAQGCQASEVQSVDVTTPYATIIETSGTPSVCGMPMTETFGSAQMGILTSWEWIFGDGDSSNAQAPTHTFTNPGNYQTFLRWTNQNGCSGVSNILYTTITPPFTNVDFTADATTVCQGQTVNFGGLSAANDSAFLISWDFGDGTSEWGAGYSSHAYNTPGVYSVTLHLTSAGECYASDTKTNYITVLAGPSINLTAQTTCDSPRANFTFNVTAGNGATGIAWQFGDGATLNTGPTVTTLAHTYSQNGQYTITATTTNGTCTASSSVGIVVELMPLKFHLGVNATTICPAVFLSDTLQEVFPPGNSADDGAFMYVDWYYADGTPFTGPQNWVNIGALGNGSYTSELSQFQPGESGLYAVMGNLNGCLDTTNTVPLKIGGTTAAFTVVQDDRCYQLPVVLQDVSPVSPGNPITSWLWNFGDGTTSTQSGTVSHTYASPGSYTVTLTVTDAAGCASGNGGTASQVVTVNGPQASFYSVGGNVLPVGSTAVFANSSNAYGAAGVTWSWTFGDGTTSSAFSPAHVYGQAGTYTVTLTAQDGAGGCVSTATLQVVIQAFNNAFQMNDSYVSSGSCPPVTVQFTNTSYNYTSLLWNFGDGQTAANVVNPSHVYAKPGTFYVSLTVVNGAGETLVTNDSVVVREPQAVLAAPSAAAVCVGQADTLFATGGKGVKGYSWDFGDGVVSAGSGGASGGSGGGGAGGGGSADSTVTHVYAVAGLYTVRLVVTDTFGCAAAAGGTVQVDVHAPPVAYVTPPVATVCLNGQVVLTANGGVTYSWQPATGLSAANVSSPVASPAVSTTYTVTVADDIGCTGTQSIGVTVVQPETLTVTPDSTAICPGKSVPLVASGAERYQWIGSTGGLSATDIADPVARPVDSSVVYSVAGGDSLGCFSDTLLVKIVLLPVPTVSAGPDETVQAGTPVTLAGEATGDVASWWWTPATYLSCTDCAQPVCTPKEPQQYVLTVTGGDGCTASDTVVVSLLCDESKVRIPDAFTPNGDGHNDRWDILGISEVNHLVIFDRWGEKVFERDHFYPGDADAGWDGMANGRPASPGVYVYFAQMTCPTGGAFERRGTVVLIR